MGKRILIINGNPDSAPERLSAALADVYTDAATAGGHSVTCLNVGGMNFPFLRQAAEFLQAPEHHDILAARDQITRAEHLVFIYPLWLGGPPALLKGFMEQVARASFALANTERGFPKGQLTGKSARIMVTMGMPAIAYRLLYGAHGVRAFNRSILNVAGIKPVAVSYFGTIGQERQCRQAIATAAALGRHAQ